MAMDNFRCSNFSNYQMFFCKCVIKEMANICITLKMFLIDITTISIILLIICLISINSETLTLLKISEIITFSIFQDLLIDLKSNWRKRDLASTGSFSVSLQQLEESQAKAPCGPPSWVTGVQPLAPFSIAYQG